MSNKIEIAYHMRTYVFQNIISKFMRSIRKKNLDLQICNQFLSHRLHRNLPKLGQKIFLRCTPITTAFNKCKVAIKNIKLPHGLAKNNVERFGLTEADQNFEKSLVKNEKGKDNFQRPFSPIFVKWT